MLAVSLLLLAQRQLLAQKPGFIAKHSVSVGLEFTPTLNYRHLNTPAEAGEALAVADRNGREVAALGYAAGVTVRTQTSQRLALEAGVGFALKGYSTTPLALVWSTPSPKLPQTSETTYRFHFLRFPVKASYTFGVGKLQGFVAAGGALNVFLLQQTNVQLRYADYVSTTASDRQVGVSCLNFVPMVSGGLRYLLSPKLSLQLESSFEYALIPLRPGLPIREHLYAGGLGLSIFWRVRLASYP